MALRRRLSALFLRELCSVILGLCLCARNGQASNETLAPCESNDNPCVKEGATCESTGADPNVAFTCTCLRGYAGDGWLGDGRTGCKATSFAVKSILEVATLDLNQDDRLERIRQLYANIMISGEDTFSAESLALAQQAHTIVDQDNILGSSYLTLGALFITRPEAELALERFDNYGGASAFTAAAMDNLLASPLISFVEQPAISAFTLGTTASPYQIRSSGLQIDRIAFRTNCLSSGCWQIDFTTALQGLDGHTIILLPRSSNGVGTLPTVTSYPCHRESVCCLAQLESDYRATQPFVDWVTGAAFTTECSNPTPPTDELLRTMGNIETGVVAGLESTVERRADPSVGGLNFRLLLDERELLSDVAVHDGGSVALGYSAELVLGVAQVAPTGNRVQTVDTLYAQHSLSLSRSSLLVLGAHGTLQETFVNSVSLTLHAVRDALQEPSAEWPAIYLAEVTFSLKGQYQSSLDSAYVASQSVRVGRDEGDSVVWRSVCWEGATDPTIAARMGQFCAPEVELCSALLVGETGALTLYFPVAADMLDASSSAANTSLVVEFVVSAVNDDGLLQRTRVTASQPVAGSTSTPWCVDAEEAEALQHVGLQVVLEDVGQTIRRSGLEAAANFDVHSAEVAVATGGGKDVIAQGLVTLVAQGDADFFDRPAAQSFCPMLADGVVIHILETATQTQTQVDALFDSGNAISVDYTTGSKRVTPTAALLALCPESPPAGDASNPITASCVTSQWQPGGGDAGEHGSLVEVPAGVSGVEEAAAELVELLSPLSAATQQALETVITDTQAAFSIDGRKNKAWFVHAGRKWAMQQFAKSTKVLVKLAIDIDTACARRRAIPHAKDDTSADLRSLGTPTSEDLGLLELDIAVGGTPIDAVSAATGIAQELCTVWKVTEEPSDPCAPRDQLINDFQTRARAYLQEQGESTTLFNVLSVLVEGADCGGRRENQARRADVATATYETLIAIADKENEARHVRDIQTLTGMPGVVGMEGLVVPELPDADDDDGGLSGGALGGIVAGPVVAVCLGAAGVYMLLSRRRGGEGKTDDVVADRVDSIKDSLRAQLREMDGDASAGPAGQGLNGDDIEDQHVPAGQHHPVEKIETPNSRAGGLHR